MVQSEVCSGTFDRYRTKFNSSLKVEQSGQFRYSILLDGAEIHSVINTSPKVFSGVQVETGISGHMVGWNHMVATGSFRNLQLTSE